MAPVEAAEAFNNGPIKAQVLQQGSGNAGRDIAGRDINNFILLHSDPRDRHKPSPSSTVRFPRDHDFVPRAGLDEIRRICARRAGCAALVGLGGVGKSQIAIEYAYEVRDESQSTWVFWVHADTRARFEEGYRRIAEATKMDGWNNPRADVLRLVRSWLCDKMNGRWVMVVDNADDLGVFFPSLDRTELNRTKATGAASPEQTAEPLSDFLPRPPHGFILVTSRNLDVAYRLTGNDPKLIVDVKPMDKKEALTLVQKKLNLSAEEDDAVELVESLEYMPLAITQAAAFINQRAPRMTVSRYIEEVRRSDQDLAHLLYKDMGDIRRDDRASNSILTTWQISFEHIRAKMPTAAQLLSLMSLFDRQGIPELYVGEGDEGDRQARFDDDIYTLKSYSLVGVSADGHTFKMHRLVQVSTKKWLELKGELEMWRETYVRFMDDSFPDWPSENLKLCQALFPHAQAAVECRPSQAEALQVWAWVLNKAAWYAKEIGQYEVAKDMSRKALETREEILGGNHPDTLCSLNNLACVLQCQGKYEEAESMHRQALEVREKVLGNDHTNKLTRVGHLARVLFYKALGKDHHSTLYRVMHLVAVLLEQGKYEEAEVMSRRALEGFKKALGKDHPSTLYSVMHLARVLVDKGEYEEAEVMCRRALEGFKKALGKDHTDTLSSLNNLAHMLLQGGKHEEAQGKYEEAQGKYEEAEVMNRQALEGREKVLGKDHPETLASLNNLACLLLEQGKHEAAQGKYEEAQGKYEEAEATFRRVLEGCEKTLEKDHPDTLGSLSNLAFVLLEQGKHEAAQGKYEEAQRKYEEAEATFRRVLEGCEKTLEKDHPDTLGNVYSLAHLLHHRHRYEEALPLYHRAYSGYLALLGPDHRYTRACLDQQSSLQQELERSPIPST